ncbi:MAG: hypothetical protein MJY57_03215 [Bacteroidales bacterium]|nr:hypothetical protein [Bacteroidales bacterium]
MRLDGRRESTNVDDRRGRSVGKIGGVGLGGAIVITHHDNLRFNSLESGDSVTPSPLTITSCRL